MLAYILALVVGLGSLALYLAAFFFPEVHRKHDFILSGIGMFYALVLWVCAGRITGGLLLGQMAGVVLLGGLGWETLNLRRGLAPTDQQTALPSAEAMQAAWSNLMQPETLSGLPAQVFGGVSTFVGRLQAAIAAGSQAKQAASAPTETYVPLKREDFAEATKSVQSAADDVLEAVADRAETLGETLEETLAAAVKAVESVESAEPFSSPPVAAVPRPAVRPAFSQPKPAASGPDLPSQVMGMVAAIAAAIPAAVQKLTKKKVSQPIYVRKQFRPDDADDSAELEEPVAVTAVAAAVVTGTVAVVATAVAVDVVESVVESVDVVESVEEPAGELVEEPVGEAAIAVPSAADPVETLTDVDLADLAQDLFKTVEADEEAVSADPETSEATGETPEPADEFADRWSGSQIPQSDVPELPIDPPFLDE